MNFTFAELTDEQLIDFIESALAEADKRETVAIQAKAIAIANQRTKERIACEEAERIAREKEAEYLKKQKKEEDEKAAQKQKDLWMAKKQQSEEILTICEGDIWINVWKNGAEKRVYINNGEPFSKGVIEIACLYVTGNNKQAPGSMTINRNFRSSITDEQFGKFETIVKKIGNYWNSVKFSAREAAKYN